MKLFEIPMVVTSLTALCFLTDLNAPPARADFTFGAPVDVQSAFPLFCQVPECINCLSADGLEVYIESMRSGQFDIWVYKRASVENNWGLAENLGPIVNSASGDGFSSITADGLELYFASPRAGGYGMYDLYVTKRANRDSPWGPPTNLGPNVNTSYMDTCSWVSSDGLELYFASPRPGGYGSYDLYVSKRATRSNAWGPAANLGPTVNSPAWESTPSLSPDGLLLAFQDDNGPPAGGYGPGDLWVSRRAGRSAPWEPVVKLGPMVNTPIHEYRPCFAPDGSALYFVRDGLPCAKAPILPIVDFNGDGTVDEKDLSIMIEHWGQDYPACDIGPFAWGDGIVDFNDLKILAEYMGKDVNDPTLLAHWKLDETEGESAADSAGTHEGTAVGDAVWQPAGGAVGGALQLDGNACFLMTGFVCDPAAGPFSALAWIKGGGPGQGIVSQTGGKNWLVVSSTGALMTDLSRTSGKSLSTTVTITDGNWHRVGFSWDGSNCALYVDDIEAARDTAGSLPACQGGLYLGAGSTAATGKFWSGLIDDVRIYSRAVQP